jgi:ankyrin repeat protein
VQIVRKCLQWEVKLNAMNQKGQSALHVAIAHRHAAVAEYLLSKPEAMIPKSGRTLLHEAAKGGLHQCALK